MGHTEQSSPVLITTTPLRLNMARDKMASSEREHFLKGKECTKHRKGC
jgi:hypothetical protein